MTNHAQGTFETKLTAQATYDNAPGAALGRMTIEKRFQGDLVGTSLVEMLSAMSEVTGSAGYVAIERVIGTLQGRSGSFVLQHSGAMSRGTQKMMISVVPDSGTAELKSIAGTFIIDIRAGQHFYTFDYTIEA